MSPSRMHVIVLLILVSASIGLTLTALGASASVLAQTERGRALPVERGAVSIASVPFTITLSQVASGLTSPVYLTHAGDGSGRLFVVEQQGRIRVIKNGMLLSTPFLNITSLVQCCGEQGLLSVAFDPDYEVNGTFYVNYTSQAGSGDTVIARYQVADPAVDVANVLTVTQLLVIDQPQGNHNGGQLQFGVNDDYLYVGMGDGGSGGDSGSGHHEPGGNAQWPGTLLGKMLRVNVRGVPTYTIPASNPFTQTAGYRPEIWALGLRNPWRFSFDRVTGEMLIGDVGQNAYEEISYQPASSAGGENYGWRCKEGFHDYNFSGDCPNLTLVPPVVEYSQSVPGEDNCSVTGGYVYRGQDYSWLSGVYFYADYCSGRIWSLEQTGPGVWNSVERRNENFAISSFGEDEDGELYVVGYSNGLIYKLASTASPDLNASQKSASTTSPHSGDLVTYTILVRNSGGAFASTVRVTDSLPIGLNYVPGSLTATLGTPDAASAPTLKWSGVMSNTPVVTITFGVTVSGVLTQPITNVVAIDPGYTQSFTRSATIFVNGVRTYLPLVLKND